MAHLALLGSEGAISAQVAHELQQFLIFSDRSNISQMASLCLRWLEFMGRSHGRRVQNDASDTTFQVELERGGSEPFSLLLGGHPTVAGLVIVDVSDSAAVTRWNAEHPNQKIEVGYVVMEVNGITEIQEMLKEFREATSAKMLVKTYLCPRQLAVLRNSLEIRRKNILVQQNLTMPTDACHCGELCSICYDEMDGKAEAQLPCGHRFHRACLTKWLIRGSLRCPLCNHEIGENCNN